MKTTHSSDVIQGDEQCRDGHYRAKQDLRNQGCYQRRRRARGGAGSRRDPARWWQPQSAEIRRLSSSCFFVISKGPSLSRNG
jgi:hypothetical protein